ncbi:MAG TPA: MATE family efflux transporter [Anaeromyxobacteraceae bacterium]|nr:MATE family efflux transporter [Anaeromyxobacteraceae bacterium]
MPAFRTDRLREELAALLRLAAPLSAAQAGQALMGVVDTAVVGRAGAVPLAGVGLGNGLFFTVAVLGIGVMMGLDPLIAQAVGAGDPARARRLAVQGGWLALHATLCLTLPLLALPVLLEPLGVEPAVAREAGRYLLWRVPGLFFLFLYVGGRAYLQAAGLVRPMVVATVVANLANLPLDVLLVFGGEGLPAWAGPLRLVPALGAAGAAIATTLCQVLQAALLLYAAWRVPAPTLPRGAGRHDGATLRRAVGVGLPTGLHMVVEVAFFSLAGLLAARLGAVSMAAHQLALSVASLTFTVAVGVGQAGSVRVGLFVGGRDRAGARRAGLTALGASAGLMGLCGLAFLVAPQLIARALTDDPAVVATAAPLLRVAALFQVFDGAQGAGAGVLRGAGVTRFTFVANLLGHWLLGLPAMLLLAYAAGLGVLGLWWGFVVGLVAVAAALLGRFLRVSSREIAPLAAARAG